MNFIEPGLTVFSVYFIVLEMAFAGQTLHIDLNAVKWQLSQLSGDPVRDYVDGMGLNIKSPSDNVLPGTDPLGSDNILTINLF